MRVPPHVHVSRAPRKTARSWKCCGPEMTQWDRSTGPRTELASRPPSQRGTAPLNLSGRVPKGPASSARNPVVRLPAPSGLVLVVLLVLIAVALVELRFITAAPARFLAACLPSARRPPGRRDRPQAARPACPAWPGLAYSWQAAPQGPPLMKKEVLTTQATGAYVWFRMTGDGLVSDHPPHAMADGARSCTAASPPPRDHRSALSPPW